jgi:2-amino-4-hydroxy-6-hydroxymethyldihydropteridine diphosphokinase
MQIETDRLTVPHPEMTKRQFVLVPLAEIAPQLPLPGGRPAGELADPDSDAVRRLGRLDEVLRRERA